MQRQKILTLHHSSALECCPYAIAAEQKARVTYDNILRLSDDPDVSDAIKFLRAREIVHFQRFGEGLRLAKERLDQKNVYFLNPGFDSK
jgi:spore coat protein JC